MKNSNFNSLEKGLVSKLLEPLETFSNFAAVSGLPVLVMDLTGQTLLAVRPNDEDDKAVLLHGCYQARRFSGRYIFLAPSGFCYCACSLTDRSGEMIGGVVAGPFCLPDPDESTETFWPVCTPARTRAAAEQLYVCANYYAHCNAEEPVRQAAPLPLEYSLEREEALMAAISQGDIRTANALLNEILGQVLFHYGGDLEVLRSRVVELTVLLGRAAMKGGASSESVLGRNYAYLRELDALGTADDIVQWLHEITRRFARNVFDFAGAKHADIIFRAIAYMKEHLADKITLQEMADHVYLSTTYFSKVFREETGHTPVGYLTVLRVAESRKLLRDLSVSIIDIPEMVGFESQSYFTKVFKKAEGCTPGSYRRRLNRDP